MWRHAVLGLRRYSGSIETSVAQHYAAPMLVDSVNKAFSSIGLDTNNLKPRDFAPVDEFHVGGLEATEKLLDLIHIKQGDKVLDIGCGMGGPMRYIASKYPQCAHVTGIDLSKDYIHAAKVFSEKCGLADRTTFKQGSATALPFPDGAFDVAITMHVAMNIPNKESMYREAARVLKPGGTFAIYDVMMGPDFLGEDQPYPVPWAETRETSFLVTPVEAARLVSMAGFTIEALNDTTESSIQFFVKQQERVKATGPSALGIHLVTGANTKTKFINLLNSFKKGSLVTYQVIARKKEGGGGEL